MESGSETCLVRFVQNRLNRAGQTGFVHTRKRDIESTTITRCDRSIANSAANAARADCASNGATDAAANGAANRRVSLVPREGVVVLVQNENGLP